MNQEIPFKWSARRPAPTKRSRWIVLDALNGLFDRLLGTYKRNLLCLLSRFVIKICAVPLAGFCFVLFCEVCILCIAHIVSVCNYSARRERKKRRTHSKGPAFSISSAMSKNGNLLAFKAAFTSFYTLALIPYIHLKPLLMSLSFICLLVCCFFVTLGHAWRTIHTNTSMHTFSYVFFYFSSLLWAGRLLWVLHMEREQSKY